MRRIRISQKVLWPGLLAPLLLAIAAEFVCVGAGLIGWVALPVRLAVYSATCVAAVMTGMVRLISPALAPVSEAYRLGLIAGAREQRQADAQAAAAAAPVAVGESGAGRRSRPLTLVRE